MEYLLPAIANLLTFADPELLVIGGGVADSLVRYAANIEAYVSRMTPFPPRIAWSRLRGRAGLVGAIRLAVLESLGTP
jgi:glucokinase